jgi:hypothetical protein
MRSTIQRAFTLCRGFAVLAISVSCISQAHPQTSTITGTVTDTTGAVIPKAKVALEINNGPVLQTIADATGRFALETAPGEYVLTVSAEAFYISKKTIHLTAATPTVEDIRLEIVTCGPCLTVEPRPVLETINDPLTLLLPLSPLPPYKVPTRNSKHRQK